MLQNLVDFITKLAHDAFPAHSWANGGVKFFILSLVISAGVLFAMTTFKPRMRKYTIMGATFLAGLFYVLEFFWPVAATADGKESNPFTQFVGTVGDVNAIVATLALGLGVYSISMVHFKTLTKGKSGWGLSIVFFISMIAMAWIGILNETEGHKNAVNNSLHNIIYLGGFQSLEATMFSLIAFYIVSAAYRAFRIRSPEASLLMGAAFVVMLGQVYAGQALTNWLPSTGLAANLRVETLSDWLLTRVNAPAVRAIGFGLGVGLLAMALRIWLSLEKGTYFDKEV